jgi:hypothetical protein
MNVFEFSERYAISLTKTRKIAKDNPHWFDERTNEKGLDIRAWLSQGKLLTAAQLCTLIEAPSLLLDLGKYADKAESQISALGNVKNEIAPREVAAYITDAAKGDADAVKVLVTWLRLILPAKPVNHAYIATRLLLGLPENVRAFDVPRVPRALLNCRRNPGFAGYWEIKKTLTRTATFYQKPKLALDL